MIRHRRICHITHITNLPSIIAERCIWCDSDRVRRGLTAVNIAYQNIKSRRSRRLVTVGSGGNLCDYVPFYFAPRSPMLFAIHQGNIPEYTGGQSEVIYLLSSTERVVDMHLDYVFSDGHAVISFSNLYTDLRRLDKIDWELMKSKYWNDTDQDNDRCRRRQAEFLIKQSAPLSLIDEIGVFNEQTASEVERYLESSATKPKVRIRRNWYF